MPWAIVIYGDDPKFLAVSTKWYIRCLRTWDEVVSRYHVQLAPPHKIYNGAWDKWCGLLHVHAMGLMLVPMNKRVMLNAERVLLESEGPVKVKLYHSHVARLNHYLHTTELCTEVTARMKPLWLPLVQSGYFGDKAWRSGEEGTLELGPEAKRALKEVHVALARSPGISVLDIVQKAAPQQESVINYHLGGDACVGEDTQDPGVAGSLHGVVWRWKLEGQEKRLPITTLEFSCLYGNVEMLMPLVPMESSEITFHSDAATAVFDMAPGKVPDSEMMAFVAQRVRSHPEVCKREGTIFVTHCRGERNQIDDAVSRGYTSVLDDIMRQLNMSIRMVELTPAFKAFTHELVALHVRLEVQGQALKQGMKPQEQGTGGTRMSVKRQLEADGTAESTVKKRHSGASGR